MSDERCVEHGVTRMVVPWCLLPLLELQGRPGWGFAACITAIFTADSAQKAGSPEVKLNSLS